MKTVLCYLLGIEHPVIAAPMGPDLTGPELVAAVSNAGGGYVFGPTRRQGDRRGNRQG
jgi:NAD(P)H-dependent flavin oxidoreductase YrpB (nitropropane dioxygenase family)